MNLQVQKPLIKIVFCIPGREFSNKFMQCWTNLIGYCYQNNIQPILSNRYTSNVYYVRSMCLGGSVLAGIDQKPWQGKVEYDYICWIDSDMVFRPEQVMQLINHDKDIVGGMYMMDGGKQFAVVKDWDEPRFLKHGSFEFLDPVIVEEEKKDSNNINGLLEVAYCGFGFLLVKKGVFESIEYPWFKPMTYVMDNGIEEFASEDVSFCRRINQRGYDIFVDLNCRVGHEKSCVY
jgi:hypothetical protein